MTNVIFFTDTFPYRKRPREEQSIAHDQTLQAKQAKQSEILSLILYEAV